ncbi:MAG: prepilin-type N-terminal cleavage/methylation domain-containing protein [Lysobacter sp.]|nr:prepilin-type N-terminal cleavage/methylation domain-containing protein [Lysobacter sp.]
MSRPRPPLSSHRRAHGFTLLDLLIALTILGILFGIAIPGLKNAVARVQAGSARSALTATLFDAQRHATVLGREVVICPGESQCVGGADWSQGWLAFIDHNGDRMHGPGEQIVRQEPGLPAGVRLRGTVGRPRIVYQPNGGNAGANITFTLCDRRGPRDALALILSNGGRLRSTRAAPPAGAACAVGL